MASIISISINNINNQPIIISIMAKCNRNVAISNNEIINQWRNEIINVINNINNNDNVNQCRNGNNGINEIMAA
jgi:hypothetical protein